MRLQFRIYRVFIDWWINRTFSDFNIGLFFYTGWLNVMLLHKILLILICISGILFHFKFFPWSIGHSWKLRIRSLIWLLWTYFISITLSFSVSYDLVTGLDFWQVKLWLCFICSITWRLLYILHCLVNCLFCIWEKCQNSLNSIMCNTQSIQNLNFNMNNEIFNFLIKFLISSFDQRYNKIDDLCTLLRLYSFLVI